MCYNTRVAVVLAMYFSCNNETYETYETYALHFNNLVSCMVLTILVPFHRMLIHIII